MLIAAMAPDPLPLPTTRPGLKKIAPYWYPYTTMAKGRWFDREILEVVSTEFRDRSVEYYVSAFFSWLFARVQAMSGSSGMRLSLELLQ